MARDYVIEVVGATRAERGLLDVERRLARELRQATRDVHKLLLGAAREAAPTPDPHTGEGKGEGVGADMNFPSATGGLRRLAGRAVGGAPLVSLTYQVSLFVEGGTVAGFHETGTGLYGPLASRFPIQSSDGRPLFLRGWAGDGRPEPFRGGHRGERKPIFDHVSHPGMRPRPFLEDTVRDSAPAVDVIYDRAVANAVKGF